jgi:sulfonate transport system permease protein
LGTGTRMVSIAVAAFFPTFLSTIAGVASTNEVLLDVSRSYRFTFWQTLWRVRVPAAAPQVFSGLQVSLQVAFVVMIVSEMLGSGVGLGAFTLSAQQSFFIVEMWSGILLLGILGYAFNVLFTLSERRILRWYRGQKGLAS